MDAVEKSSYKRSFMNSIRSIQFKFHIIFFMNYDKLFMFLFPGKTEV